MSQQILNKINIHRALISIIVLLIVIILSLVVYIFGDKNYYWACLFLCTYCLFGVVAIALKHYKPEIKHSCEPPNPRPKPKSRLDTPNY